MSDTMTEMKTEVETVTPTPGPWTFHQGSCEGVLGTWFDVKGQHPDVPDFRRDIAMVFDSGLGRAEADARLMSAAPDLLDALKYLLELGGDDDRRIAAEAAIAKAEGKDL